MSSSARRQLCIHTALSRSAGVFQGAQATPDGYRNTAAIYGARLIFSTRNSDTCQTPLECVVPQPSLASNSRAVRPRSTPSAPDASRVRNAWHSSSFRPHRGHPHVSCQRRAEVLRKRRTAFSRSEGGYRAPPPPPAPVAFAGCATAVNVGGPAQRRAPATLYLSVSLDLRWSGHAPASSPTPQAPMPVASGTHGIP